MPITFNCPLCQARMTVPDAFAGKRGKCNKCKGTINVPTSNGVPKAPAPASAPAPTPTSAPAKAPRAVQTRGAAPAPPPPPAEAPDWARDAPPPPPPRDIEDLAIEALADAPKQEDKEDDFIEFACPRCDETVRLALEHAGKKHPCPLCRNIITVPRPAVKKKDEWRDKGDHLPSGARRDSGPIPDDVWGGNKTGVSEGSLKEAGVIQDKRKPATLLQRAWPFMILGSPVLLLVGGGLWLWSYLAASAERRAFDSALAVTTSKDGPRLVGPDGLAALETAAGEYYLNSGHTGCASKARDSFAKAVARLGQVRSDESDAMLADMLAHELPLAGDAGDVVSDVRRPMSEVHKLMASTIQAASSHTARLEGLRRATALLAARAKALPDRTEKEKKEKDQEAARPRLLAMQMYAAEDADRAEALAVVGLELLRAGERTQAEEAMKTAASPYASKEARPQLRPAVVALAVALGQEPPEALKVEEAEERVGRMIGMAFGPKADDARQQARVGGLTALDSFRRLAEVADATEAEADVLAAAEALARVGNRNDVAWEALRVVRAGRRAKMSAEALGPIVEAVPAALRPWARLELLRARMESGKAVDVQALDKFEVGSLGGKVARLELSRHNMLYQGGWASIVAKWEDGPRALGSMGVALGMQDR